LGLLWGSGDPPTSRRGSQIVHALLPAQSLLEMLQGNPTADIPEIQWLEQQNIMEFKLEKSVVTLPRKSNMGLRTHRIDSESPLLTGSPTPP
jgi:hypothetical protein